MSFASAGNCTDSFGKMLRDRTCILFRVMLVTVTVVGADFTLLIGVTDVVSGNASSLKCVGIALIFNVQPTPQSDMGFAHHLEGADLFRFQ